MSKTIRELTEDLLAAPSACAEVKETAQNYLDAIGGENEAAAAKTFVAELEEDIMPIDGLIAFAESDMGAKVFGEEGAKNIPIHAKDRKAAGENIMFYQMALPGRLSDKLKIPAGIYSMSISFSCTFAGTLISPNFQKILYM